MLTVEEAKFHLRVDGNDEDAYIEALVLAATESVVAILTPAPSDEVPLPVAPPIKETQRHAVRLLVGHWYANREAATPVALSEAPLAVQFLLNLERPTWSFL